MLGAPFSRRRCGSHPEYAHSMYKNALNKFSFIRLRQRRTSPSRQSCETAVRFLIRLILIAKIFCAVVIARTSAVNGNRHCVAFLFRGFPRRFTPRNDIWGGCHNRNAVALAFGCGCPHRQISSSKQLARNCGLSFCPSYFESKEGLRDQ